MITREVLIDTARLGLIANGFSKVPTDARRGKAERSISRAASCNIACNLMSPCGAFSLARGESPANARGNLGGTTVLAILLEEATGGGV